MTITPVRAFTVDVEEDGEVFPQFCWDCPQCGETNEATDQFVWKNGRYEQRNLECCDYCDLDDVQLFKG